MNSKIQKTILIMGQETVCFQCGFKLYAEEPILYYQVDKSEITPFCSQDCVDNYDKEN